MHIYIDGELASMSDGELEAEPGHHLIEAVLAETNHGSVDGGTDRVRIMVKGPDVGA